jgi:hypothetical protein
MDAAGICPVCYTVYATVSSFVYFIMKDFIVDQISLSVENEDCCFLRYYTM